MKKTFMAIIIGVLMTMLCSTAVQAQTGAMVSFKGLEVSTGHEEPGEAYGWMCYAKTTGVFPGNFTMSLNYDGVKGPDITSEVTGGSWTLPVYGSSKFATVRPIPIDSYRGVVFGNVDGGDITWDKTGTTATVQLKLSIRGGTQSFSELRGTAILYGTIAYGEKGAGPFEGTIYFEFE